MAQLIVRNLEDEVVRRLKVPAAEHGRSAESEHREILRAALMAGPRGRSLKDALMAMPDLGDLWDKQTNTFLRFLSEASMARLFKAHEVQCSCDR